jgi:hypothetical protein
MFFGTDLNDQHLRRIPVHADLSHIKVLFMSANGGEHAAAGAAAGATGEESEAVAPIAYGVNKIEFFGRAVERPFVGGFPLFGPVGRFSFEHLRGPLVDADKLVQVLLLCNR